MGKIIVGNDRDSQRYGDEFMAVLGAISPNNQGMISSKPIVDLKNRFAALTPAPDAPANIQNRVKFLQRATTKLATYLVRLERGIMRAPNSVINFNFGTIAAGALSGPVQGFGPASSPYAIQHFTVSRSDFRLTNLVIGGLEQLTAAQVPAVATAGMTLSQWFGPKQHLWDFRPWIGLVFAQQTPIVATVFNEGAAAAEFTMTCWVRSNPCSQDWSGLLDRSSAQYRSFFDLT